MARFIPDGGPKGAPTIVILDQVGVSDNAGLRWNQTDQVGLSDQSPKLGWSSPDSIGVLDSFGLTVPASSPLVSDQIGVIDTSSQNVNWTAPARSGSPANDAWGDAWTDSTAANTSVNHGADANLTILNTGVIEYRVFSEIDLTRFVGMTAKGGTLSLVLANSDPALTKPISLGFGSFGASRPFNETTITQANQPATQTAIIKVITLPPASNTAYTVSFTATEMAILLGKWALMTITTGVSTSTFTGYLLGRESSNPPILSFTATI